MPDREITATIDDLIEEEGLPSHYAATVEQTILPMIEHIVSLRRAKNRTVVVGINGAQGTGKSTLALFLRALLCDHWRCPTASFSLDDLYLTRAERRALAEQVHPLLVTRGVPGTHDVKLGRRVIDQLRTAGPGDQTRIPAFDKSCDDRVPLAEWPVFDGRAEVILLEGWCVGALPEGDEALAEPLNTLEAEEDPSGTWRRYVNQCLKDTYHEFFGELDSLIMLEAPSMSRVLEWRTLQEHKLAEKTDRARNSALNEKAFGGAAQAVRIMNDQAVIRFIMHYERVTRSCLQHLPSRADVLIEVAGDHSLSRPHFRAQPQKPRVLLLSAYDAGSHRNWREQLVLSQPEFEWHVLSLSPRFFRWRIRGNALTWLNEPLLKEHWDLLLVTSMVDLASIRGFHPNLAHTPALLYMHENQFAYPASDEQHNSVDPQMVNLYSAIAAEGVLFNSDWNRRSFFDGVEKLFQRLPDGIPEGALELIAAKSRVLPVPVDDRVFRQEAERENPEAAERLWGNGPEFRSGLSPLRIVWAARWEYDKGPDRLLAILQELERRTVNFQVCILGESFRKVPEALTTIQHQFAHRLVQFGYAPSRTEYYQWLGSADVILSTALHEFQGLAVLEAVAAGCVPIVPGREVYPELFPPEYVYPDCGDDIPAEAAYAAALIERQTVQRLALPDVQRFSRDALTPIYKALLLDAIDNRVMKTYSLHPRSHMGYPD
ncbi:tRNA-queuosine alpha-mannosyltransferase domain-containing protein [Marinobacter antarcticus]|nr:DUF3524 domain-containing protein [Marinobacter antarcticus]